MRRWISASSSRIFCCSMPVRRCNCNSMMACACFSLNSKRAISESRASRGGSGGADQPDDFVEVIERFLEAEQQMLAVAGLAQFVLGAAADHFDAVVDEELDQSTRPSSRGWPLTMESMMMPKPICSWVCL